MVVVLSRIERDTNWKPLHHFDVVTCRVFGRDQAEAFTRCRAQTFDMPFESAAQRVDLDVDRLAGPHPPQLVLLEIGGDPHIVERHRRPDCRLIGPTALAVYAAGRLAPRWLAARHCNRFRNRTDLRVGSPTATERLVDCD